MWSAISSASLDRCTRGLMRQSRRMIWQGESLATDEPLCPAQNTWSTVCHVLQGMNMPLYMNRQMSFPATKEVIPEDAATNFRPVSVGVFKLSWELGADVPGVPAKAACCPWGRCMSELASLLSPAAGKDAGWVSRPGEAAGKPSCCMRWRMVTRYLAALPTSGLISAVHHACRSRR